jgi:hypothetical protein
MYGGARTFLASTCVQDGGLLSSGIGALSLSTTLGSIGLAGGYFYPGTETVDEAQPLYVSEKGETPVEFQLGDISPPLRIRGEVIDTQGRRIRDAKVTLVPAGGVLYSGYTTDFCQVNASKGTFDFTRASSGKFDLRAEASIAGTLVSGYTAIDLTRDTKDVRIVVRPRVNVDGIVLTEGGVDPGSVRVELIPTTPETLPGSAAHRSAQQTLPSASPDATGAFSLYNLKAMPYRIRVAGLTNGAYVKSIHLGDSEISLRTIQLDYPVPEKLRVTLANDGGTVEASLRDPNGGAIAGITAVLVPEPSQRGIADLFKVAVSDASGGVRFEGVAPGNYKLFRWVHPPDGAWRNDDFLKPFEDRALPVTVEPRGVQVLELGL